MAGPRPPVERSIERWAIGKACFEEVGFDDCNEVVIEWR